MKNLRPRAIVTYSINNIFYTIACKLKKKPNLYSIIYWVSCGSKKLNKLKYRGTTKNTYIANYDFGYNLAKKLLYLRFTSTINLIFKGSGKYVKSLIKGFKNIYKKNIKLLDLSPISMNGCKLKKSKRI